jgi:hypothetical protein
VINERLEASGFTKSQREEVLRTYKDYDLDLERQQPSYEELAVFYKSVVKDTGDYKTTHPDDPTWIDDKDLKSFQHLDTYEELKAELLKAVWHRDHHRISGENETYDKDLADYKTYEELAEHYKQLFGLVHKDKFPNESDFQRWREQTDLKKDVNLDTLEELKAETRDLWWTARSDAQRAVAMQDSADAEAERAARAAEAPAPADAGPGAAANQWPEGYREWLKAQAEVPDSAGAAVARDLFVGSPRTTFDIFLKQQYGASI